MFQKIFSFSNKLKYISFLLVANFYLISCEISASEAFECPSLLSQNLSTGFSLFPQSNDVQRIVIFVHGYSGSGSCCENYARAWQNDLPDTLFVAPNAPYVCVDKPSGYQWWYWQGVSDAKIKQRLSDVSAILKAYTDELIGYYNIKPENIAFVGVSQGAILSLEMIHHVSNMSGILSYVGAFYPSESLRVQCAPSSICLINGDLDDVIPSAFVKESILKLESVGARTESYFLDIGHIHANEEGLQIGIQYLKRIFGFPLFA